MTTTLRPSMVVEEMPIEDIKIRFRLRKPKEDRIQELATSIKQVGLINAVTVDSENYLICGWHRVNAMKFLGYETIPVIKKETSRINNQLMEVLENISRVDIVSTIEYAEHMVKSNKVNCDKHQALCV